MLIYLFGGKKKLPEMIVNNYKKSLITLNIWQIQGNICCYNLYQCYRNNTIISFYNCFNSLSIYDANVLILWGASSLKLSKLIEEKSSNMLHKNYIMQIIGCNNTNKTSIISNYNNTLNTCTLTHNDYKKIIEDISLCLLV